jgi:hypothetical protein
MHLDMAPQFFVLLSFVGFAVTAIVQIAFAIAVHRDATSLGDRLIFVSPFVWAMGTLTGGVLAVLAYWILHYSSPSRPGVPTRAL